MSEASPQFCGSDTVVVEALGEEGYKRAPTYAVGTTGTVASVRGSYPRPDDGGDSYLYVVQFAAERLWEDDAEPNESVFVDLWEECLVPAGEDAGGNDD